MPRQGGTRCRLRGSPRLVSAPHRREMRQAGGIGGDVRSGDGSFPAARRLGRRPRCRRGCVRRGSSGRCESSGWRTGSGSRCWRSRTCLPGGTGGTGWCGSGLGGSVLRGSRRGLRPGPDRRRRGRRPDGRRCAGRCQGAAAVWARVAGGRCVRACWRASGSTSWRTRRSAGCRRAGSTRRRSAAPPDAISMMRRPVARARGRARNVRRVAPECGLDERGLVGDLVAVLVGDGSVQEAVVEVVAPGAGHASGLTAQDVLDDLEVAGPPASLLTAQPDHAAGVDEHLGQQCHGRREGVLTGRGERGGESAEDEVVEVAVCGRAVCVGDRREFGQSNFACHAPGSARNEHARAASPAVAEGPPAAVTANLVVMGTSSSTGSTDRPGHQGRGRTPFEPDHTRTWACAVRAATSRATATASVATPFLSGWISCGVTWGEVGSLTSWDSFSGAVALRRVVARLDAGVADAGIPRSDAVRAEVLDGPC